MSHRHDPESAVRRVRSTAAVVVWAGMAITVMAIAGAAPSEAQRRFMTARGSSVTIDYSVLESLGPAPTVPRVLRPSMPRPQYPIGSAATRRLPAGRATVAGQRIVLTPPGSRAKARRITKRSPPARRQISKSRRLLRSPPRKLVAKRAVPPPSIPPPPISSTPLAPAISDRPRPPRTADRVAPPPPSSARKPAAPRSAKATRPRTAPKAAPQTAALTPAREGFAIGRSYRLAFAAGLSKLDGASTALLDEIAGGAKTDRSIRLKLLAYAGAAGETASQSRRLSLSRALAVRSYLIDKGVRSVQFEVQAKGKKLDGGPPDRVDVIVTKR